MKKPAMILVVIGVLIAAIVAMLTFASLEYGLIGGLFLTFLAVTWIGSSEMHKSVPGKPVSTTAPVIACFAAVIITCATYLPTSYLQLAMFVIPSLSLATLLFFWGRFHQMGRRND